MTIVTTDVHFICKSHSHVNKLIAQYRVSISPVNPCNQSSKSNPRIHKDFIIPFQRWWCGGDLSRSLQNQGQVLEVSYYCFC